MRRIEMAILEDKDAVEFMDEVESFFRRYHVIECKFQRNLYYEGIGASACRDPRSHKRLTPKSRLMSSYVAFIIYKERLWQR